ncbi:hypothetical protein SanaruYs_02120 [Chryseotalea sanaruensis]|uniref:DUF3575 domain-containing protein n=1 Tax=Chryseotalea sanaruensis TaxID=2482724 RepID=A0A401U506_9BACT|nr:DUF3575 domain-containing protein [Chryseotalea sanaruensis]GCC49997.1 hypothetical protein SanaruYs_02120 [Chryseotalea sanaruensis]
MRLLFTSILLLTSVALSAQDSLQIKHRPDHAIKWSPLHLWGFYPSLQFAYEKSLGKKLAVQADVGYVVNYGGGSNTEYMNKRGVKLKAELRYYFESLSSRDGFYMSIEPYITSINFDRSVTLTECFDPDCQNSFLRNYAYKVEYREMGISGKGGYMIYFDRRIFLDVSLGWSWRSVDYDQPSTVPVSTTGGFNFFGPNEEDRIVLSPLFGARLGYRFR